MKLGNKFRAQRLAARKVVLGVLALHGLVLVLLSEASELIWTNVKTLCE